MLTDCSLSIALPMRDFNLSCGRNGTKEGGLSALAPKEFDRPDKNSNTEKHAPALQLQDRNHFAGGDDFRLAVPAYR